MKAHFLSSYLALAVLAVLPFGRSEVAVVDLRCEYRVDPLGLDERAPRLSWRLEASSPNDRGVRQTACQVLVATSPDWLVPGRADLWDTGRWQSEQSIQVPYAGRPLDSGQRCWWTVRVWDQQGRGSAWSAPAQWTMGLLHPADWKAHWIGLDETEANESAHPLKGVAWIWFPEGNPAEAAPIGTRWFRRVFNLPPGATVRRAAALMAADNSFELFINGLKVGGGNNFKQSVEIDLSDRLKPGENVLALAAKNVGESANPAGLIGMVRIELAAGEPIIVRTDASWKTSAQEQAGWERLEANDTDWVAARELGPHGTAPWNAVSAGEDRRLPARMLRKEFVLPKKVRRATAYVSGLGLCELHLNGGKVSDDVLSPGLTEYPKRVFYVTYEVTSRLQRGANAVGVWLGNGRYFAPRLTTPTLTRTYGYPKLLLQLAVEFTDGSATNIVSDETWRLTTRGPIRANNEYDGEEYDGRLEMPGWSRSGFNDMTWRQAERVAPPGGQLAAQMMEPIRVIEELRPVSVNQIKPGVFIFDFGQNMVGWCRLKVRGPRGATVTLRHAETLKPDGTLYLDNLRAARATDVYTLKGEGEERYEPRFTYHGFRFVELRGYPGTPTLETLEGCVVHDAVPKAGDFACSNELLNRIYRNVFWGVRGNYRSLPTDCPQRDERQGWLGDRSAECKGESYLFQLAPLYAKWLQDFADAQQPDGRLPDVAPAYWPIYSDNVTWPSTTMTAPAMLYEQYGDERVIARHYPSMKRWLAHLSGFITNHLIARDQYGDWCVPPEDPKLIHSQDPARKTKGEILASAYFCHDLMLMARYAAMLGKPEEARAYGEQAERMKRALNAKYLDPATGRYDNGSQTSSVLPLAFGLVPEEQREKVFKHLVEKITRETRSHLGTGLIGGQWLMRTLSEHGRGDLAYTIARQTDYPSWGYMVNKGATTVWELWNGDTADPAMNSGNHVMLVGDLVIWLNEYVAGLKSDPAEPAFKHILMQPHAVGDLKSAWAQHHSPYGRVVSDWRVVTNQFRWNISVPPNTRATAWMPGKDPARLVESGQPVSAERGVSFLRQEANATVLSLDSGHYRFVARDWR